MLIRLEALELAANAGESDDSDRFALNSIQVKADGSVIVTDGWQILRIHAAVEEPGLFDALLPAHERGFEGDVLIHAADAKDFKAACRKALKRAGRKSVAEGGEPVHVVVAKEDDQLTMATADGVVERRFVIKQPTADEPKYPNIERVLPTGDKHEIIISVDLMMKLLRTLKRLNVKGVTLGLTDDPNKAISITAKSLCGDIDGALMPMRSEPREDEAAASRSESVDRSTGEIGAVQ